MALGPARLRACSALIKATLINSGVDILHENNDAFNDNDYPIPNNHEGWGPVNLVALWTAIEVIEIELERVLCFG